MSTNFITPAERAVRILPLVRHDFAALAHRPPLSAKTTARHDRPTVTEASHSLPIIGNVNVYIREIS
jgi:hypothetical protein